MDETLEGLNENEFQALCADVAKLAEWMESENHRALLTPEQLATALAILGE